MSVRIIHDDCLAALPQLASVGERFHTCITYPPYHLTSIVKRFGGKDAAPAKMGKTGAYARASAGFMGKQWDGGDVAFRAETWAAVLGCLLPGAHLVAFGSPRTWHRMAVAIEDAGFEIRDTLCWLYGTGFAKSHNLHGEWEGWGSALKPAFEPVILARKPLDGTIAGNVLKHGTGALNIDACRIEATDKIPAPIGQYGRSSVGAVGHTGIRNGAADAFGRWPANVIHDGSDEAEAAFAGFGVRGGCAPSSGPKLRGRNTSVALGARNDLPPDRAPAFHGAVTSPSRFFFSGKADASDRADSKHPTVKPGALMRWLVQLITPPGGTVLDPFAGTGSTGLAADQLGMNAVLIEQSAEYVEDIKRKLARDAGLFGNVQVQPAPDLTAAYDAPLADLFAEPAP